MRGTIRSVEDDLMGLRGPVVTRIRGGDRPGQVRLGIRGGTEDYLAYAAEPIERHVTVLVIRSRGPRAVDVTPWDGPPAPVVDP